MISKQLCQVLETKVLDGPYDAVHTLVVRLALLIYLVSKTGIRLGCSNRGLGYAS